MNLNSTPVTLTNNPQTSPQTPPQQNPPPQQNQPPPSPVATPASSKWNWPMILGITFGVVLLIVIIIIIIGSSINSARHKAMWKKLEGKSGSPTTAVVDKLLRFFTS